MPSPSGAGSLSGKVALITGGANGIGLASARRLAGEGAAVHLLDLDSAGLQAALEELGPACAASVADVTDEDAVAAAVGEVEGPLDVVMCNAGIPGLVAPVQDYPLEAFARVLAVHVTGAFLVVKHAVPRMADGGSIVVNSSVVGLKGAPRSTAYSTAKHALVGLARSLALELAPRAIRVNTIHPGPTDTALQHAIEKAVTGAEAEEAARAFEQMIPLRRHADPAEIAELVLFLAGDGSRFVTGAALAVDGGMSA